MKKVKSFTSRRDAEYFAKGLENGLNYGYYDSNRFADAIFFYGQRHNHDARFQPKYIRTDPDVQGCQYMGVIFLLRKRENTLDSYSVKVLAYQYEEEKAND